HFECDVIQRRRAPSGRREKGFDRRRCRFQAQRARLRPVAVLAAALSARGARKRHSGQATTEHLQESAPRQITGHRFHAEVSRRLRHCELNLSEEPQRSERRSSSLRPQKPTYACFFFEPARNFGASHFARATALLCSSSLDAYSSVILRDFVSARDCAAA